jgi:trehalose 6-phosphate synthase/phosphatase
MKNLIFVSNRLPTTFIRKDGDFLARPSIGGLATGVGSVFPYTSHDVWIGWPGCTIESEREAGQIRDMAKSKQLLPVFLSEDEIQKYYEGFCNRTIWPNFHRFNEFVEVENSWWETYVKVNEKFCDAITSVVTGDSKIWINDFHLMLLPRMLRRRNVKAKIGFFLHIPFPDEETFCKMPCKKELLEGVMDSDSVGFYVPEYKRNFISAAHTFAGETVVARNGSLARNIGTYPIGIDYNRFERMALNPDVGKRSGDLRRSLKSDTIILSVDRLDYTKGIPEKLIAFEQVLHQMSGSRKKICLFLVVVPSRENIPENRHLKTRIENIVARVNDQFGNAGDWLPILYHYDSFSMEEVSSFYCMADIMLITSKMDGMNLVSKEFIASKTDNNGILILSRKTGAAQELKGSILVDPDDPGSIAGAIIEALNKLGRKEASFEQMRVSVREKDVNWWANSFISSL